MRVNNDGLRDIRSEAVACRLPVAEQRLRQEELSRGLFARHAGMTELADGYEYLFPGDGDLAGDLARFIAMERECCPFLAFELLFAPGEGPIRLRVRGPEGTRAFLDEAFTTGA
jgi:hypothetical protein